MSASVLLAAMPLLLSTSASAEEVILRNDGTDEYSPGAQVIWLEFPECAISVLTPEPDEYPLEIHTIQMFFVSNTGNLAGESGYTELGIQILDEGAAPTGRGDWVWGEEAFLTTASSEALNELYIDDSDEGWEPVTLTEGSLAVWLCPSDPSTGADWPYNDDGDVAGIVIDSSAPSAGNYLMYDGAIYALANVGVSGAWVIRAVAGEGSGGGDGGGDDGSSGSGGDDGGDGDLFVDSITPASMFAGESPQVAVVGEGFDDNASAYIGGLPLSSVTVSGDNALTGTVPSTVPMGTHDVLIQNPDGTQSTLVAGFTVLDSEELDGNSGCGCNAGLLSTTLAWLWAPLALVAARRRREP